MASLWSKIKEKAKSTYQKVDSKLGGYLPGGQTPSQVKSGGTTTNQQTGGTSSSGGTSGSGTSSSSGGSSSSSGGGSSGGGMSRVNTLTGQAEYVLPSGMVVPVNEQTTQAIVSGKSDFQVALVGQTSGGSKSGSLIQQAGGTSSSLNQSIAPTQQSEFGKKIEALKSTPLGTPTATDNRGLFKKGVQGLGDTISGSTGAVWLLGNTREVPKGYNEETFLKSTERGARQSIVFGIPGVVGFTPEGKLKTAWSKDKDKKVDLSFSNIGRINPLANVQSEWTKSAQNMRQSGAQVKAQQESQIKSIEQISKDIDDLTKQYSGDFTSKDYLDIAFGKKDVKLTAQDRIDLMFGKKEAIDFDESKKQAPGIQAKQFEKEADSYLKSVESFNSQFGGKELSPETYEVAVKEKAKLDAEREKLTAKQDFLTQSYDTYQSNIVSKVGDLRKVGVETDLDAQGNIVFKSKELDTTLVPYGYEKYAQLKKNGKATLGSSLYAVGSVAHLTAETFAVGFATGGTGAVARVGTWVAKLPKVLRTGVKIAGVGVAVGGVASKGYQGYKVADNVGISKFEGATLGTTMGIGQVGGFVAGGYLGTKAYYSGVQDKILAGKYTKSVAELREGTIIVDKTGTAKGGLAKQMGIYETKVKGTDWTIKTSSKLTGQYGKNFGQSDVKMISQFQGKAPKGLPKTWTTQGKTLESGDYAKLRTFTQSGKSKVWYEQDYLLKRSMLNKLKVDVSQSKGFEGYTELERLKFLTSIKSVGQPVKVGKALPKDVWKADEVFRFTNWKGKGKVVQPWEWGEAKPDSTFGTKQYVLWKETKPVSTQVQTAGGNIKLSSTQWGTKEFQSLAQSQGMSTELLKQQLKNAVVVVKQSQLGTPIGKKGQVALTWTKPQVTTQVPKVTTKPAQFTKPTTMIDTKALLKLQLKNVVPGLISKQFVSQIPTTLTLSAGLIGTKQLIDTKQSLKLLNNQALAQRLQQVQLAKQQSIQFQQPSSIQKVNQAQVQELALQTAVITPTMTSPPFITTGVPIIPGFPMPDLYGWGTRTQKETLRGKSSGAYLPDFTSKALGLKPKTLSKAQLKKLLRTDLTGLEIRRGVIIK